MTCLQPQAKRTSNLQRQSRMLSPKGERMAKKQLGLIIILALVLTALPTVTLAKQAEISGDYCYEYGDSESLMAAKEISYAMALRKAIERYKTFVASTSVVDDFQLRKDFFYA